MQTEEEDQFVTCSCGSSDHLMRLRSSLWKDSEGNPVDFDISIEMILNPQRTLAKRIIAAVKYIFCCKNDSYHFEDIVLDDENIKRLSNFLQDCQNKKKRIDESKAQKDAAIPQAP